MLVGEFSSKVGEKKRIAVPKKLRGQLGKDLIVTRGYEGCLVLVNKKMWEKVTREIIGGSFIDKKIRDSGRFLIAGAHEVELDAQGRFVLPEGLHSYAAIKKEAIFLGLVNWVEIWSVEKWRKHEEYIRENGDRIAQELSDISSGEE